MIATVRVMVKQLMELRGGYERNNNQEVSDEQAGECVLPSFGVPKPRHLQ